MCIKKVELESKVQELRSLKTLKEETENELKAIEREIIAYMVENGIDTEITDTAKNNLQTAEPYIFRQREADRDFRGRSETVRENNNLQCAESQVICSS